MPCLPDDVIIKIYLTVKSFITKNIRELLYICHQIFYDNQILSLYRTPKLTKFEKYDTILILYNIAKIKNLLFFRFFYKISRGTNNFLQYFFLAFI